MRTAEGPLIRYRADLPSDLVERLAELCGQEPSDQAFSRLPAQHDRLLKVLETHAPVGAVWSGPAYILPPLEPQGGAVIDIGEHNGALLQGRFEDWLPDVSHRRPFKAVLADGAAASICASVRISPIVHCAGVATHPDVRRKGHAVEVVAEWARAVRTLGATPFYSTSWDNIASQRVAERLGGRLVGVDFHVT